MSENQPVLPGASVINCCWAAGLTPRIWKLTGRTELKSGLVEAFHTESGHFIKLGATAMKAIVRRRDCRAECLSTSLTLVATTTLSPSSLIEAVANDGTGALAFRERAVRVGTAETLHGWWTL